MMNTSIYGNPKKGNKKIIDKKPQTKFDGQTLHCQHETVIYILDSLTRYDKKQLNAY